MYSTETIDRLFQTKAQACCPAPPRSDGTAADAEPIRLTPIEYEPFTADNAALCSIIELILKDPFRLNRLIRARSFQSVLVGRLLVISLVSFTLFGVAMSLVLTASGEWPSLMSVSNWLEQPSAALAQLTPIATSAGHAAPWTSGDAFKLTAAYALGLVAATCVCLPSLYFYCLLAGVRLTMLDVVLTAVKAKAEAAIALLGILPIYVAVALGIIIFRAGGNAMTTVLVIGLLLPFFAGLRGTASLYNGFAQLCSTMPPKFAERRECFLRRLVLSWSGIYSAVMPVMIYSIWEVLSRF
jgi:hypothetical protein